MNLNYNENSYNQEYDEDENKLEIGSDFSENENKNDYKIQFKKLEKEYKESIEDYETRIETLTNTIYNKNTQIEDLHLRIKLAQEEYEEIIIKSNNDKKLIYDLQESISTIKKENDTKVENLNAELKEFKAGLERRDYLSNEINLYKEKFEKALMELNLAKQANEALELKCNEYREALENFNINIEQKEKEIQLINLKKKEIENELIKNAEIYGFKLSNKIFRNYSVSNFDGDLKNLLSRKSNFSERNIKKIFFRGSTLNSEIGIKPNLESIYENSDDSENENYETNYNSRNLVNLALNNQILGNANFQLEEEFEENDINVEEPNENTLDESFKDDDNDVIEENLVLKNSLTGKVILKNLRKVNLNSVFQANDNPDTKFTQFNINDKDLNDGDLSKTEFSQSNINDKYQKNMENCNQNNEVYSNIVTDDLNINLNQNNFIEQNNNKFNYIDENETSEEYKKSNIDNSPKLTRYSSIKNRNKISKRISLKDIIDANLDEFENSPTRRQTIKHYKTDNPINFIPLDLKKEFNNNANIPDENNKDFNYESWNYGFQSQKEEKFKDENRFSGIKLHISTNSFEVINKFVSIQKENFNNHNTDYLQKITTNNSENNSDNILSELKSKIEELSFKNIELQSMLANEKFIGASKLKMKEFELQKIVRMLNDIKNRVKGQF